jgi:ribonuclease HI
MPWIKRNLRGTMVFARARSDGALDIGSDGRVDVKYKLEDGAKVYRAAERNLGLASADDVARADVPVAVNVPAAAPSGERAAASVPDIVIYTDGGAAPNPGPMGIGVVIERGKQRREICEYLGVGTNNIAELTAIERAIDALEPADRNRRILIHADSAYAIGVVGGAMKPKKNLELVARIRDKARGFPGIRFVKVRGHAGVAENERCDALVGKAIATGAKRVV